MSEEVSFATALVRSGLSIEEAEATLGVSERHIRRYIAGETAPPKLVDEKVREIADARYHNLADPTFRFIDLFAGIGGLRLGFETIGGRCVFTSEWDTSCPARF